MGLEIVVRPVVLPNIRPRPPQIPVVVDEDEEPSEIVGNSGRAISLSHGRRWSFTRPHQTETRRTFDLMRVKNPEDSDQYVDVEVTTRLYTRDQRNERGKLRLRPPDETANIEAISRNNSRTNSGA